LVLKAFAKNCKGFFLTTCELNSRTEGFGELLKDGIFAIFPYIAVLNVEGLSC
jgi:hypothetical protein